MIDCDCTGDIWLWPNMRVYISTQNVCFVGIFSTEEVDGVHQNCHRREGVEGIAPCLGPTTFVQFVPTRWTLLFPRVTK